MIQKRATKAGDTRYDARLRAPDGKERSATFRTKKEAERWERAQRTSIDSGAWVDPRSGKITLASWADQWQATIVHLRPSSRRIYADNLRLHIVPILGEIPLAKLRPPQLQAWISQLSSPGYLGGRGTQLSPTTVNQVYRTLNRCLGAAVEAEILPRNPLAAVKPPRPAHEEMRFMTAQEVATLADTIDERYSALVLVACFCGLRAGELAALRRRHVDLLHRTITVAEQVQEAKGGGGFIWSTPKTAASRRKVPVPAFVAERLLEHLGQWSEPGADGMVFPSPDGGPLRVNNFRDRVWLPATRRADLEGVRLHDCRHTCAALAISAGADPKALQRMLGHASAAMTLDRYGHLMPGQLDAVAERLDQLGRSHGRPPTVDIVLALR